MGAEMTREFGHELEFVTTQFYQCFDARSGYPTLQGLHDLFEPDARICQITDAGVNRFSVSEFIESRVKKYRELELSNFHEWELRSENVDNGHQVYRYSHYQKAGQPNGVSTGIKVFQFSKNARIQWLSWIDKEFEGERNE